MTSSSTIALNRRAKHDYHLEQRFEAGLALQGWEVKSLRAGQAQLVDSHVHVQNGEAFLLNAHIAPLQQASSHVQPDPLRPRKLLLHRQEIGKIATAIARKGYTCIARALYWRGAHVKCELALAKGKKQHDKRQSVKERDWQRSKERVRKLSRNRAERR